MTRAVSGFFALSMLLVLPPPAGASVGRAFEDPTGDANLANDQGLEPLEIDEGGPDTRPASASSADLIEGRYETTYVSVAERDQAGAVVAIRRVATGLRVRLRTAAPAAPSFGPTVALELWADAGGCPLVFGMYARGPQSQSDDPPQRAELRTRSGLCPDGIRTHTDGISLELRGPVALLAFPFTALQTPAGPLLSKGMTIGPGAASGASTRSVHRAPDGVVRSGPVIDVAGPLASFVIGSDVPPDVDCLAAAANPECGSEPTPDTGEDLHAALLASGPASRTATAGDVDLEEEFAVTSFQPDGGWMTFGFDVAELDGTYLEVNLASRLLRDGTVDESWLPISSSFASWKLFSGPADDPYRSMTSIVHDTPYGITLPIVADGVERVTLLAAADVDAPQDVGLVVAVRGTDEPVIEEPFPDTFGEWMRVWTEGKRKVRVRPERWGQGVAMAAWLSERGGITPYDARRGVEVSDDRTRLPGLAEPGTMQARARLSAGGPALVNANLFYVAQADQTVAVEWRTPEDTRRGERSSLGSSGASLFATEAHAGPGEYLLSLDVSSGPERSSSVALIAERWALDPAELLPGLPSSFVADPAPADALVPSAILAFGPPGGRHLLTGSG